MSDEIGGQKISWVAHLDMRISRAAKQQRQPANLQLGTGADQKIRPAYRCDQTRSRLQLVRILKRRRRDCDFCDVTRQFLNQGAPFRFAGKYVQRIRSKRG